MFAQFFALFPRVKASEDHHEHGDHHEGHHGHSEGHHDDEGDCEPEKEHGHQEHHHHHQQEEEEDLVDPMDTLRDRCRRQRKDLEVKYKECNDRVNSKSRTAETCVEELFDLLHFVDNCVAKSLFPKLK